MYIDYTCFLLGSWLLASTGSLWGPNMAQINKVSTGSCFWWSMSPLGCGRRQDTKVSVTCSSFPVTPNHPAFGRHLSISNFKMSELVLHSDRSRNIGQDFLLFPERELFLSEQPFSWLGLEFTSLHLMTFLWVYWFMQGIWGHTELEGDTSVRRTKFRRRGGTQASLFGAAKSKHWAV